MLPLTIVSLIGLSLVHSLPVPSPHYSVVNYVQPAGFGYAYEQKSPGSFQYTVIHPPHPHHKLYQTVPLSYTKPLYIYYPFQHPFLLVDHSVPQVQAPSVNLEAPTPAPIPAPAANEAETVKDEETAKDTVAVSVERSDYEDVNKDEPEVTAEAGDEPAVAAEAEDEPAVAAEAGDEPAVAAEAGDETQDDTVVTEAKAQENDEEDLEGYNRNDESELAPEKVAGVSQNENNEAAEQENGAEKEIENEAEPKKAEEAVADYGEEDEDN